MHQVASCRKEVLALCQQQGQTNASAKARCQARQVRGSVVLSVKLLFCTESVMTREDKTLVPKTSRERATQICLMTAMMRMSKGVLPSTKRRPTWRATTNPRM